jgi:ankyrin repeat protein
MNSIDQELFVAARDNNVPEVSRLLSVGADVNATDRYGYTSLHRACYKGHLAVVIELLSRGANIDAKNHCDWTPLHWACINGHLKVVTELLTHGADIEAKDSTSRRPLHWACCNGQVAVVNELLSPSDSNGAPTSMLGKRKSGGANTEAKDNKGNTPLHLASGEGYMPVVKALLSVDSNILANNNHGNLPIHLAASKGKSEESKYLLRQMYATTRRIPLHELVEDLTWISNPNSTEFDVPPLRYALHFEVLSTDDVVEIIEFLVERNPELLCSRDQDGSLPLHVACRRGAAFTIVQSLVDLCKASVKSTTPQGDLPLFLACELPEPSSLDTIFLLMKLYPDLVYR